MGNSSANHLRVLVLGASGMLGHRVVLALSQRGHDVRGTVRGAVQPLSAALAVSEDNLIGDISVENTGAVAAVLDTQRPDVVINCVGIVKQLDAAGNPLVAIPVNSLFPHRLSQACGQRGIRMIHFSTDCVFSGRQGPYSECSDPDPQDLYGRSKLLGEVNAPHTITLRTSIIGHELAGGTGLVSWVLNSRGSRVHGFARALYTGITTNFMGEVLHRLMVGFPKLCGVWHLAAEPVTKFELICLINEIYGLGIDVLRDEDFCCDRRLDGSLFQRRTGIVAPAWTEMLEQMHSERLSSEEMT